MEINNRKSQKILPKLVIIDGFSNSGKSLIAPIISYLKGGENWIIDYKYESIAQLEYLNKLDKKTAKNTINLWLDSDIYDISISRKVNFRKTDMSSVYASGMEELYLERMEKKDGDYIIDEIKKNQTVLPLHLHYIIGFSDIYLDLAELYLIVIRNPLFLIKSWIEANWVNIFCQKQREFTLCIEKNDKKYPWFVKDYIKEYEEANDIEKSILIVYYFYKKMEKMIKDRENVLIISFEDFIVNPNRYIKEISDKLHTTKKDDFDKIMKILNLPRQKEKEYLLDEFLNEFEVNESYKNKILELLEIYKRLLK